MKFKIASILSRHRIMSRRLRRLVRRVLRKRFVVPLPPKAVVVPLLSKTMSIAILLGLVALGTVAMSGLRLSGITSAYERLLKGEILAFHDPAMTVWQARLDWKGISTAGELAAISPIEHTISEGHELSSAAIEPASVKAKRPASDRKAEKPTVEKPAARRHSRSRHAKSCTCADKRYGNDYGYGYGYGYGDWY